MNLLIDTQCWLWWYGEPEKLGPAARKLISDPGNVLFFSAASIWEIAIKVGIGKLILPESPKEYVLSRLARDNFTPLAIEAPHAAEVERLPRLHKDPFDRMLIAQAMLLGLPVLTSDSQFGAYPIEVIPAQG